MKKQAGFFFVEVMVSVLVISIMAAIAIPFYNARIIKAKLTEVTENMEAVRVGLVDYRKLHGTFTSCDDAVMIRNSLGVGVYVAQGSRIKNISVENGAVKTTLQNIGSNCDGKTLTLVPIIDSSTDGVLWRYSGTLLTDSKTQAYAPRR